MSGVKRSKSPRVFFLFLINILMMGIGIWQSVPYSTDPIFKAKYDMPFTINIRN